MGKELAKKEQPTGSGLVVAGQDAAASISRVTMFQGTAEEVEKYGEGRFKRGEFFDTLDGTSFGMSLKLMPLMGWTSWSKWSKGGKSPEYAYTDKADVPPEDLVWNDGTPPAATECVHLIVVIAGSLFPAVFNFKKTGLAAFSKVIGPLEGRRGAQRKGPGFYELFSTDDKNPEGKPFKRLSARPLGDPPADVLELAETFRPALDKIRAKYDIIDTDADAPI